MSKATAAPTGITWSLEQITPDKARKYLENNKDNRNIREKRVGAIARDIQSGKWEVTHQSVAFDKTGRVIDGQHRLTAIIKADIPVWAYVARYDCPVSAAMSLPVDIMAPRRYTDILDKPPKVLETARKMLDAGNADSHSQTHTTSEIDAMATKQYDLLLELWELSKTYARYRSSSPIRAAVALLCIQYPESADEIKDQYHKYVSMTGMDSMWPSVAAYLRFSINSTDAHHHGTVTIKRAWTAFRPTTWDRLVHRIDNGCTAELKEAVKAALK